ncbi:MAG TPA: DUF4252 domain-containing protein [Prolixibacteraceae bacterium]|nr:DUF4252 domain-containing protein [Prolixibacteraceae bacterium]
MNLFYKLGVLVAIIVTTLTGSAQSKSYRIFDEFSNREGFTSLSLSKSMIDAVDLKLDDENKKITGDLNEIRILFLNREKSNLGVSLPKTIADKFNKLNYKKVEPNDKGDSDDVEFWIEGDSKKVRECHVIVTDSKDNQFSCLVSFYGNFKVEDLEKFEKFSRKQAEE